MFTKAYISLAQVITSLVLGNVGLATVLLDKSGFEIVEHKFTRAGPIIIPILGRRVKIIGGDSKILNGFEPLKTTHVIKCKKK